MIAIPPRTRLVEQSVHGTTVLMIAEGGVMRPFTMADLRDDRRYTHLAAATEMEAYLRPRAYVPFFGRTRVVLLSDVRHCLERMLTK